MSTIDRATDEALRRIVQGPDESAVLSAATQQAIRDGRRSLRRRRRATAGGLVAAAIVVAVAGAALDAGRDGDATPPADGPDEADRVVSVADWAAALPGADMLEATYVSGGTLFAPGREVRLPGTDAGLVGQTNFGIALLIEEESTGDDGAYSFDSHYVLLDSDDTFTDLPRLSGSTQNALVSPDGELLAYASHVVDLESGETVADIPPDAIVLQAWTSVGLTYVDTDNKGFLWSPGSPPIRLPGDPGPGTPGGDFSVRNRTTCTQVVRIVGGSELLRETYSDCDGGPQLRTVSPDGATAVDEALGMIDTATGERRTFHGAGRLARPIDAASWTWTETREVTFVATDAPEAVPGSETTWLAFVVSCSIDTLECSRSPGLKLPAGEDVQLTGQR